MQPGPLIQNQDPRSNPNVYILQGVLGVYQVPSPVELLRAPVIQKQGSWKMAEMLYYFRGVSGVWEARAGRPVTGTYPQVIHRFIISGEFGSLRQFVAGRGPRCALHTTRAQDPRPFGPVPWFGSPETV